MKVYQIEDTIIAYFDGRLSDAEGAELLHRVSVSPEIREIFQQQEMLRKMSVRAARNVSISPNVEEAVFANIAALRQQEQRKMVGGFWSVKRGAVVAAVAILLGAGVVASLESSEPTSVPFISHQSNAVSVTSDVASAHSFAARLPESSIIPNNIAKSVVRGEQPVATIATPVAEVSSANSSDAILLSAMPRTAQAEQIQPPTIISHSISSLLVNTYDEDSRFEIGLDNSTHATIPAAGMTSVPFQNWALHAAYALDEKNIAGVRFDYGRFDRHELTSSPEATLYSSRQQSSWMPVYGVYFEHREFFNEGRIIVDANIGGGLYSGSGLYSGGSLITLGLGGKLPISEHMLAGATLSLTRKHDGGLTKEEILQNASQPVIFEGSDIHNTLITRIEYGLSYRF